MATYLGLTRKLASVGFINSSQNDLSLELLTASKLNIEIKIDLRYCQNPLRPSAALEAAGASTRTSSPYKNKVTHLSPILESKWTSEAINSLRGHLEAVQTSPPFWVAPQTAAFMASGLMSEGQCISACFITRHKNLRGFWHSGGKF